MQFKEIPKFRYKDLPQELYCILCKSVCQNPCSQGDGYFNPNNCDRANGPYSMQLVNQIQQFIQILCDFCGEYQKYFHYKIHSNVCQLIFYKSQFLNKFKQISLKNHDIRCQICGQIPYRPQTNNQEILICLFCIQKQNIQNLHQLSTKQQNIQDEIIYQCNSVSCQRFVKLNKTLKHYRKCQFKDSEINKSDEYLKLINQDKEYQQLKYYCKQGNIGLKYQKQLIFKIQKLSYDFSKTKLVKKQLLQQIDTLKKYLEIIEDEKL